MSTSVTVAEPLAMPAPTGKIGAVALRDAVVVAGIVVQVEVVQWVGGPVLEVHLRDVTGSITLAFLGRRRIGGIEPGAFLTAAGTVGRHAGAAVILNPRYWLAGRSEPGPHRAATGAVEIAAPAGAGAAIGRPHHA